MNIHKYLLENAAINWQDVAHMHVWSDGGRHFRSAMGISTIGVRSLDFIARLGGHKHVPPTVQVSFGLPAHFKNQCDGQQAVLRSSLTEAAKSEVISDIETMADRCRNLHEQFSKTSRRMPAIHHEYMPAEAKDDFVAKHLFQFSPSSFLELIGLCQSWHFKLNDSRRREKLLWKSPQKRLTAINFCATMLPGSNPQLNRQPCRSA